MLLLLFVIGKGGKKKQQALLSPRTQFPSVGYKENSVNNNGFCQRFDEHSVQNFKVLVTLGPYRIRQLPWWIYLASWLLEDLTMEETSIVEQHRQGIIKLYKIDHDRVMKYL